MAFFFWYFQKKVVPLQPQTCAGDVCTSSAEGSRHIKRRLLALCSDYQKSRKFQLCSGLSNDRCPTGYRLSKSNISLCCSYAYAYAMYKVLSLGQLSILNCQMPIGIYSAWASRCRSNTMGNARASGSGTAIVGLHAFFICLFS